MLKRRYWKVKALIDEYPRSFWTLVIAVFIDRLGGSILFPFFTLYLTRKFDVCITTFRGYGKVLRDNAFMLFWVASMLTAMVYVQMSSTLAVYLRDTHGVMEQGFGLILSMNALIVVLFQFPVTRRVSKQPPFSVMARGALLYAVGFAMYGFVSDYGMFLAAMIIITIGEMYIAPVGQAIVAKFAPEDMRGRYMAFFGFSWAIPFATAPLLAGLVMDNLDPRLVWIFAGICGLLATGMFWMMHVRKERELGAPAPVS